jgi:heterodisulfide reductase subunit A
MWRRLRTLCRCKGMTNPVTDFVKSDCLLVIGSNFAENHPSSFSGRWNKALSIFNCVWHTEGLSLTAWHARKDDDVKTIIPRIGVYVCECGINIASKVNVEEVAQFAAGLPNVSVARTSKYTCSEPGQDVIQSDIREGLVNRVVVASCTPRMHETTFRRALAAEGLNPYFFEMANIREHVSWITEDPGEATEKAKRLVRAAVFRVAYHVPLEPRREPVTKAALVVGGGIAGIQAALTIANSGYHVYLVEKEPSLGGHMIQLDKTFPTLDCST